MATEEPMSKIVDLKSRSGSRVSPPAVSAATPTLLSLMSGTAAVAEYYNDLSSIISKSPSTASSRVLTPNSSCAAQSKPSSQATTPLSRDSPFFFSDSASCILANQSGQQSSEHRRFPSTLSNDDRLLRNCGTTNSSSNTSQPGSMVAIDFSVLTRNSPATVGGLKSTPSNASNVHMGTMNNVYHHPPQTYSGQVHGSYSQYNGAASLYSTTGTTRSHEEDIYEDLCYVTLRSSREREKALGTLLLEPIEKRDYCIKELVETEKNYCEALRMIINHFYKPLSQVLHMEHRRLIFNNLKSLTDLHSKFYNELCRACSQTPSSNVSSTPSSTPTANVTQPSTPTNLIPSASMPSLSMIGANGAMTNGAYVGDGSTTTLSSTVATAPTTSSNPNSSFGSLSSSTSTLLLPSLTNGNSGPPRLSACFLAFKDKFLIYGDYCANLPKAQALLDDLTSRDEHVGQCVAQCQNKANDGKFKLRDLLSLPMQRILKYHLLLGELIKSTTESHEDYAGLKQAHDVMLDIGGYINEEKRDKETLDIIRDVQRSIVDLSMPDNYELKDYGRLLTDGEVRVRSHDDPRMRLKNRYVFVFDKVVLMCKALRGQQYCYKDALILEDFKVEEICSQSPISKLTKHWSHGWVLVHSRTKQMYTFFVKTDDLKRKWLEAIERAQENVRPKDLVRTDHKFAMSTVPVATYCACCSKILRGTWYQGYMCTVCNVSVHKGCIASVKSCGTCSVLTSGTQTISVRKDSLVLTSSEMAEVSLRQKANSLRLNSAAAVSHRSQVTRSLHCGAPPTPSRTKRAIAKAITTNFGGNGQLAFVPNDTIIVYSKHGTASWFGRNVRTEEEGTFAASLVTELASDSPASSSLESPTVGPNGPLRFSYEDPFGSVSEHFSFPTVAATLPRKFPTMTSSCGTSSTGTPSPQTIMIPSSPLAASTPVLNQTAVQPNMFFNFNSEAEANVRLIFGNGFNLEEYAWFAGSMDRDTAQSTLSPLPHGCFLVRISPKQKNNYAISINYNGQVKHMRVCVTEQAGITPTTVHSNLHSPDTAVPLPAQWPYKAHFYLSETRYFRTIVDLVRWYEMNSLSESFNMVNTKLHLPYKKAYCQEVLGHAVALYAFTGTSSAASSFLSLKKGDHLTVLSRAAEDKGWWKGAIGDRVGYFPFKYVTTNALSFNGPDGNGNLPNGGSLTGPTPKPSIAPLETCTNTTANTTATTVDSLSISSAITETSNLSPTGDQSFSAITALPAGEDAKMSPSVSPSFCSSASSSPTTQSSPVNSVESRSDTSSLHSRQASSDGGIEVPPFSGANQSPPPPPVNLPVTCFNSLTLTHPPGASPHQAANSSAR